jgi:hypothetical protein
MTRITTVITAKTPPPDKGHTDSGKNQSNNQRLRTRTCTARLLTPGHRSRRPTPRRHRDRQSATARRPTPDAIPPPAAIMPPDARTPPPPSPDAILPSQDALTPPHRLPPSPNARQVGVSRRLKQHTRRQAASRRPCSRHSSPSPTSPLPDERRCCRYVSTSPHAATWLLLRTTMSIISA